MHLHKVTWIHLINLLNQILRVLVWSYRSVIALYCCQFVTADVAKLFFQKQRLILSLQKIFFPKWKWQPIHVAAKEELKCVFIIKDFLSLTVFRVSLRSLISESSCTESQSQKDISHLPTLPSAHQRRKYWSTHTLAPASAKVRDDWGHAGLCLKKRTWIREPLTGSVSQSALSEPFGYSGPENKPGHGGCKRRLFVM